MIGQIETKLILKSVIMCLRRGKNSLIKCLHPLDYMFYALCTEQFSQFLHESCDELFKTN